MQCLNRAIVDFHLALGLLTRLPITLPEGDQARAAWAYPLVGLVLGGIAAAGGVLVIWAGWPSVLVPLVPLLLLTLMTGALHEDGLADSADGLWGGWDAQNRLQIMRDSHIGTYGVLALVFSFLLRWSALAVLFSVNAGYGLAAMLAAAILSRAALPVLMSALPHARGDGLSHRVGPVSRQNALIAVGIAVVMAVLLLGGIGIWAALWGGLAGFAVAQLALWKIRGQTGDILGAAQQICEIVILLSLI